MGHNLAGRQATSLPEDRQQERRWVGGGCADADPVLAGPVGLWGRIGRWDMSTDGTVAFSLTFSQDALQRRRKGEVRGRKQLPNLLGLSKPVRPCFVCTSLLHMLIFVCHVTIVLTVLRLVK